MEVNIENVKNNLDFINSTRINPDADKSNWVFDIGSSVDRTLSQVTDNLEQFERRRTRHGNRL